MGVHRWQKEFEDALKYKNAIILCNNIRDRFLYLPPDTTDAYELLNITDYLVKFLKQRFIIIKVYDSVDKITDYSPKKYGPDIVKSTELTSSKRTGTTAPDEEEKLKEDAKVNKPSEPKESTVDRDLVLIRDDLTSLDKCSYIFPFADKTLPSNMSSIDAQKLFLRIEKMIQNMKPSNRLILLYLSDEQMPSYSYTKNPKCKIVNIPSPERSDLRTLFQYYWKIDKSEIEKAVNISHGLKFLEVEQLIASVNPFDIKRFEEVVRLYKFGEQRDYWGEVTLDKLLSAEKFFLESQVGGRGGIIGQKEAINKVIDVLKNAVADIQRRTGGDPSRPKGVLFFAGPTGVGKTLTAQKLATFLFGGEDKLLRFDMSEYKDEHQLSTLYGSPPGYVGYESGGTLTNAIRENPFSVILFDEIEKADPRIWDIFLQILSDGRLTDKKGPNCLLRRIGNYIYIEYRNKDGELKKTP